VLDTINGIDELTITPCGAGDEDTCTVEDIEKGGVFIISEVIVFLKPTERTGPDCFLKHIFEGQEVSNYPLPEFVSEWRGHLTLYRGKNVFRFCNFGDSDFELSLYHRTWFVELIISIVRALIVLTLIQTFIVQTYQIPSSSMEHTFYPGDYVLVEKISHVLNPVKVRDIVVFQFPLNFNLDFVKRIVAESGDEVILSDMQLYVNGKTIDETGIAEYREWKPFAKDRRNRSYGPVVVPDESFLVFGDNRDNSYDSRGWGSLPAANISGKPWLVYWPPHRMGFVRNRNKQ
jgi:signal peptidase I